MEDNKPFENTNNDYTKLVDVDPTKIHIEKNPSTMASNFMHFLKRTLTIRTGVIKFKEVVKNTEDGVEFKGYNVWILICSIIIASVGLNVDSTAVIIGAMLISPLMGPIRGVGFGVGTNDLSLIRTSIKNIGITVAVSIVTSYIYFLITPIDQLTTQLFLRTEPNFLDVIIAFTGGLAGVIAAVKGKNDTVIPGVAIATALMPPLCTAGYGLANGEWTFFFGASYLFLINSVLITLSTIIIVRYLHFPKREYVDSKIEKKVKNSIIIFMIVILAPSTYLFYTMIQRSVFEQNATEFVNQIVKPSTEGKISTNFGYENDSSYIDISISGDYVGNDMIAYWKKKRNEYDLGLTFIKVYQGEDLTAFKNKVDQIAERAANNKELLKTLNKKDEKINKLAQENDNLKKQIGKKDPLDFKYLLNAIKIDYPEFKSVKINRSFSVNNKNVLDTNYIILVDFKENILPIDKPKIKSKISNRLKYEINLHKKHKLDTIPVYGK